MRDINLITDQDEKALGEKAVEAFFDKLEELIEENNRVVVSLCGGSSVEEFYSHIPKYAERLDKEQWKDVHFFFTDERLVSPLSEKSNHKQARDAFLMELGKRRLLLEENVHRFRGGRDELEEELARYDDELGEISDNEVHIPILGVGKDGHVGSLFPDHELLDVERKEFLLISDSPKPPSGRITISPKHIRSSISPFLFFLSEEKQDAYDCFKSEDTDYHDCPCKLAKEGEGELYVVTDLEN